MAKAKYILLLLAALIGLAGCNETDDVEAIFTGKTWKLTVIKFKRNNKECRDYWVDGTTGNFNEEAFKLSNKRIAVNGAFEITFSGTTTGDDISGKSYGKGYKTSFTNSPWRANGRSNDFSVAIKKTVDEDPLATAFLKALSTATSYGGNDSNLYLYFTEGQQEKYMLFHVTK